MNSIFKDIQGLFLEILNNLLCRLRTDPLNETGAEIFFNRGCRGRLLFNRFGSFELPAVFMINDPSATTMVAPAKTLV